MGTYLPRVELALKYTTYGQSEIGRSVGLGISTLCGEISVLVISIRVCSRVVGVAYNMYGLIMILGWDWDRTLSWTGMGPYRPQMTVTLCTIPGQ